MVSSIPGSGQSPGEGNGNPFQYPCLENAHGQRSLVDYSPWVTKTRICLKQLSILKHDLSSSKQMSVLKTGLITERIKNHLQVENVWIVPVWAAFHYEQCSSERYLLRTGSQEGRGVTAVDGATRHGSIIHVKLGNFCTVGYNDSAAGSCANW